MEVINKRYTVGASGLSIEDDPLQVGKTLGNDVFVYKDGQEIASIGFTRREPLFLETPITEDQYVALIEEQATKQEADNASRAAILEANLLAVTQFNRNLNASFWAFNNATELELGVGGIYPEDGGDLGGIDSPERKIAIGRMSDKAVLFNEAAALLPNTEIAALVVANRPYIFPSI